jgi:hypothetical protein
MNIDECNLMNTNIFVNYINLVYITIILFI